MGIIQEVPPAMVLVQQSADRMVFRFRSGRWCVATLAGGLALVAASGWFQFTKDVRLLYLAPVYFFGLLLLYSSLYSFTANQFLVINGTNRSIHFHKRNLYGRVDWDRPGSQFTELRAFRPLAANHRPAKNWIVLLVCADGLNLFLGENEFGFRTREDAIALAGNIGRIAGINVAGL